MQRFRGGLVKGAQTFESLISRLESNEEEEEEDSRTLVESTSHNPRGRETR